MKKQTKKTVAKTNVVGIFQAALKVVCKKCKAKIGKPCVHTILHKGKARSKPHRVRLSAVKLAPAKAKIQPKKKVQAIGKRKAA